MLKRETDMETGKKDVKVKAKKEITQSQIAGRLSLYTAAVAVVGGVLFGACAVCLVQSEHFEEVCGVPRAAALVLLAVTAVLCYAALWQFAKVCREIGRENSFSVENYLSFRIIGLLFLVQAVVWIVFLAVSLLVFRTVTLFVIFVLAGMICIWLGVAALASTLAKLIDKARQIREENDYTI